MRLLSISSRPEDSFFETLLEHDKTVCPNSLVLAQASERITHGIK